MMQNIKRSSTVWLENFLWLKDPALLLPRVAGPAGVLLPLLIASLPVRAYEFDQRPVLVLTEENDFVAGTDRWYTQGAKISYFQADNDVPRWMGRLFDHVPSLGYSPGALRLGYQLGQSMFTPANTHTADYLPDDRPYAGWLYTGATVQRRGVGLGGFLTVENFQMDLGIVGPDALARQVQTWFHAHTSEGWNHQLPDEFGFALKYGRGWLIPLPSSEQRYVDIIPQAGLSAGNVDSSFRAGTMLRAGWNLPDDFGAQPIESVIATSGGRSESQGGRWSFYAFTGVEGKAVLRNEFLDGNMFRDSVSIDKENWVGEWRVGVAAVFDRVELTYTHIFRTREFRIQPEGQAFGSFSLKVNF
jgi:hypothetical protein